jgi:hypothetical protein
MSLRAFTFAALALAHEEGIRFHVETLPAVAPPPADVKQKNAQSMAMLQAMLGGVKKAPAGARR